MTANVNIPLSGDVFDALQRAIIVTEPDGTILVWNRVAAALFGWTGEEAVGANVLDVLVPPESRREAEAILAGPVAGTAWDGEFVVNRRDGRAALLSVALRPIRDATGQVVAVLGESSDITDQRAELRLAALQAVASALAQAGTADEVAEVIVREGSAALGGRTGSLCVLDEAGERLELVREVGYAPGVVEQFRFFPVAEPLPAGDALRGHEIVFLSSLADRDARYPALAGLPATDSSFAVMPLLLENGRAVGVFTIGFPEERELSEDDREFLAALASLCAQALDRARLFESTQLALAAAERANARLAFLDEASELLGETFDYREAITRLAALVVPRLADACAVMIDEDGDGLPIAIVHRDPAKQPLLERLFERDPQDPGTGRGFGAVLASGEPRIFETNASSAAEGLARDAAVAELLDELGIHSAAIVPLRSRGRVIGALGIARHRDRPITAGDFTLAQELAARAAVAIDNARAFGERTRVADRLQANLLPRSLPSIPGLDVAVRYAAAGDGVDVGGDFYDVFAAGTGWVVTIGDVRGKGLEAAHLTAMARHTIRALAPLFESPSRILGHLDERLRHAEPDPDDAGQEIPVPQFCTVALGRLEPTAGGHFRLRLASAGHPLPLLLRNGRVEEVGVPGGVLGIGPDPALTDVTVELQPGDVLVMFTDGITERHEGDRFFDEAGVAAVLRSLAGQPAAAVAAAVEDAARSFVDTRPHDDMAVVALRCRPTPSPTS